MSSLRKEIVAGRNFYFLPAPYMTLKITVENRYDSERLKRAILQLESAHPTINNVIEKNADKMYFKDAGKHVPLIEYDEGSIENWKNVVSKTVQESVDLQNTPGVKVLTVDKDDCFDLIIICHHIYGDGISLKQLMDDLLYIYSTGHDVKTREGKITITEDDLPEGCKIPEELKNSLSGLIELWNARKTEFSYNDYQKMNELHHQTVGYGLVHRRLKGSFYRNLKGKCKELNVTINSAISTAMAAALQGDSSDCFEALIAADTRNTFRFTGKGLANCASCVRPIIDYDKTIGFWDNVKIVDAKVKEERANTEKLLSTFQILMLLDGDILSAGYFAQYGLFCDMEVLRALTETLGLGTPMDSFDVSNIGVANFENTNEDFKLRDCCYIPNLTMTCDCTFGAITFDGVLDISLAYKKNHLPEEKAIHVIESIIKILKQI